MRNAKDLTSGNITKQVSALAFPIIGTLLIQMTYNMTDMIWLGRTGSVQVAAVTLAGFFTWFGNALMMTTGIGSEITVSQTIGKKEMSEATAFARNSIMMAMFLSLVYAAFIFIFSPYLLKIFSMKDHEVVNTALSYSRIISAGYIFFFVNPTFTSVFNAMGRSSLTFMVNATGLILNIILDPVFIFYFDWGAKGAAAATSISQFTVYLIFFIIFKSRLSPFEDQKVFGKLSMPKIRKIIKNGFPMALNSMLFCSFSITLTSMTAKWGKLPVAAMGIGTQIEAISWMSARGFSTALSAFTGQNFGAGIADRIKKGYFVTLSMAGSMGLFAGLLFFIFPHEILTLFFPNEQEAINLGALYLQILAVSQIFMSIEISSAGGFNGLSYPVIPAAVSIVFTFMRIPASYIAIEYFSYDYQAIWWSISLTSVIKGILLVSWFLLLSRKIPGLIENSKNR